jgi:hypothetical protein
MGGSVGQLNQISAGAPGSLDVVPQMAQPTTSAIPTGVSAQRPRPTNQEKNDKRIALEAVINQLRFENKKEENTLQPPVPPIV